jgi:hypothetical protein
VLNLVIYLAIPILFLQNLFKRFYSVCFGDKKSEELSPKQWRKIIKM